jgi:beta-glucanase (GH16 family)
MKKAFLLIFIFFVVFEACNEKVIVVRNSAMSDTQYKPEEMGYKLFWEDNFDGTQLDTTKWRYRESARRVGFFSPKAISLKDGFLNIAAIKQNDTLYTALVETKDKFMTTYGYFECRAQMQQSTGIWSAFWLQSPKISDGADPAVYGAEVDIFEYFKQYGKDFTTHAIHYAYGPNMESRGPLVSYYEGIDKGFHTYALEWTPEKYVFYIDGYKFHEQTFGLSHIDEYIILSLEIPAKDKEIKDLIFPDAFVVDYVKVYKKEK